MPNQLVFPRNREGRLTLELAEAMPSIEEVVRASLERRDAESTDLAELQRVRLLAVLRI